MPLHKSKRKSTTKMLSDILVLLILLFIFGGFYPFETNAVLFGRLGYYLSSILIVVLLIFALIKSKRKFKLPDTNFTIIVGVLFIYFMLWGLHLDSPLIRGNAIYLLLSYIIITSVLNLIEIEKVIKFFTYFVIFSGVMIIIGLIVFTFGKLTVISTFDKGEMIIYNYGFFFVKLFHGIEIEFVRPNGYFDEPGSFAYMAMLMLFFNKMYLRKKWIEVALIILPIATTSVAHFFTSFLYIAFFYTNKKNRRKFFLVILFVIVLYFVAQYFANQNSLIDFLNKRIFVRIENLITGEGGNSRQGGFDLGPKLMEEHLWGESPEKVIKKYPDYSTETPYSIPTFYGLQGILIYFLPFIYVFFVILKKPREEKWMMIKVLIIWSLSLLQRPFYIHLFYIFALYFLFFHKNRTIEPNRLNPEIQKDKH